jgi:hypothetical protein
MNMSGLPRPAVALFAVRGDRSKQRHWGSEVQWNRQPD